MPESTMEMLRVCVGIFFVIYGYVMSIVERYLGMPFFGSKYQVRTGTLNGFVATFVGAVFYIRTYNHFT